MLAALMFITPLNILSTPWEMGIFTHDGSDLGKLGKLYKDISTLNLQNCRRHYWIHGSKLNKW